MCHPGARLFIGTTPLSIVSDSTPSLPRAWSYLGILFVGYVGVYLCRKNLSVAVPLIQESLHVSKAQIGMVASASTLAYGIGKMLLGPLVDRFGGRTAFLLSLLIVTAACAAGGLATGLTSLVAIYSTNRFFGAAAWGSMVKQVPDWFPRSLLARAISVLCLSYVLGGACAVWVAGRIAALSGNNWRAVMALPAVLLGIVGILCWVTLPKPTSQTTADGSPKPSSGFQWRDVAVIFRNPQFYVVCALSFTTTLSRECFNTWTVDFLKTDFKLPVTTAANLSTGFDLGGVIGILGIGWIYDRLNRAGVRHATALILGLLGVVLIAFPLLARLGTAGMVAGITLSGLLLYGPYSLLSGALAVDLEGKERAATVACLVDAVGYLAGVLAGSGFGKLVDGLGYGSGFGVLGGMMLVSGVLCLGRFRGQPRSIQPVS